MRLHIRHFAVAVMVLSCLTYSVAQTVHLTPIPRVQFLDNNGKPLAGGFLYSYTAGTTTPQATYTDYTGLSANPNPVVLDSGGFANVWLLDADSYKLCLQNSMSVQQYCIDGIQNPTGGGSSFNPASPPPIGNVLPNTIDGTVITAHTNFVGNLVGNVTGNVGGNLTGNVTGNVTGNLTGNVTGGTIDGIIGGISPNTIIGTAIVATGGFTGNLGGNVTGNVTGNLFGNATTATTATTALNANNALAVTGFVHFRTSATCSTTNVGGNECTSTFSVPYTYTSSSTWDVVCNGIGQTGYPILLATAPQSGTTFNAVITNGISGSGAVISGWSALACIAYGN